MHSNAFVKDAAQPLYNPRCWGITALAGDDCCLVDVHGNREFWEVSGQPLAVLSGVVEVVVGVSRTNGGGQMPQDCCDLSAWVVDTRLGVSVDWHAPLSRSAMSTVISSSTTISSHENILEPYCPQQ